MKFFFKILPLICLFSILFTQCKDDDTQIFRAYVEGKITYNDGLFLEDPIHLVVDKKIIAETFPKQSGSFVLAGPYTKGDYELKLKNYKIASFATETQGCKISNDSLSIVIPNGVTYVFFDNIVLK